MNNPQPIMIPMLICLIIFAAVATAFLSWRRSDIAARVHNEITLVSFDYHPDKGPLARIASEISAWLADETPVLVLTRKGALVRHQTNLRINNLMPQAAVPLEFGQKLVIFSRFLLLSVNALLKARRQSLVITFTNPPFLDVTTGVICILRRIPFVIVAQELYPLLLLSLSPHFYRLIAPFANPIRNFVYRKAKVVICISHDSQNYLAQQGIVNTVVIENWFTPSTPSHFRPLQNPTPSILTIRYAGNLGMACDLEVFEAMLARLPHPERFRFNFIGEGYKAPRLKKIAAHYQNVTFSHLGEVSAGEQDTPQSDACLILTPHALHAAVFSSKLCFAAAMGIPVIAIAPRQSTIHSIIASHQTGISAPSDDLSEIVACFEKAYSVFRNEPLQWRRYSESALLLHLERWNGDLAKARYTDLITGCANIKSSPLTQNEETSHLRHPGELT